MKLSVDGNGEYLIKNFRLIEARERMGFSQSDAARRAGLLQMTYYSYERMRTKPKEEIKIKIARVLERSIEYLFPKSIEKHYKTRAKSEDIYDNYEKENLDLKYTRQKIDADELINKKKLIMATRKALNTLTQKERAVIDLRFGITDGVIYTLEEVGKIYGFTRERIRQIESDAIRRLKHPSRLKLLREFY